MKSTLTFLYVVCLMLISQYSTAQVIQAGQSCTDAIEISCGDAISGSTVGVINDNTSSGATSCITTPSNGGQNWYSFTASSSQLVSLSLCGSNSTGFDSQIHVFSGNCGALSCVTSNDDACNNFSSSVSFLTSAGTSYMVRVGGFATSEGSYTLTMSCSDVVSGCMDPSADNYNPDATVSDNSCIYSGCTDPYALNYNAIATVDDGSCQYCDAANGVSSQMYVCTFGNGANVDIVIVDASGNVAYSISGLGNNQIYYFDLCLSAGQCYTAIMSNSAGLTGWNGGYFWINAGGAQIINQSLDATSTVEYSQFSMDGSCNVVVFGCTDPTALNYNAEAEVDDSSCTYPVVCDNGTGVSLTVVAGIFASESTFNVLDESGAIVYSGNGYNGMASVCLADGCYTVVMYDSFGDGWNGGVVIISVNGVATTITLDSGSVGAASFGVNASDCAPNVVSGCTNAAAPNYDPAAIFDDGSCIAVLFGCTDSTASNYNADATIDDGSCIYPFICENGTTVSMTILAGTFPSESTFSIIDESGAIVFTGGGYAGNASICLADGCYTVMTYDSFGDGWNGGSVIFAANGLATTITLADGSVGAGSFGVNTAECAPNVSAGCTNAAASNYDASAIYDDGSCIMEGCTDAAAMNYNPAANTDDGSCTYCDGPGSMNSLLYICTYGNGNQVELSITDDAGNVVYYASGLNNNAIFNANICLQPGVCYTATMANNFGPFGWYGGYFWINAGGVQIIHTEPASTDQYATVQFSIDGTCGPILGCTDPTALNYNPEAQVNDGTCQYPVIIYGCTDSLAYNFNASATIDDGSCFYIEECSQNAVLMQFEPGTFANEGSFTIVDANGNIVASGAGNYTGFACLPDGCYTLNMYDTFGDGWDGGGILYISVNGAEVGPFTMVYADQYFATTSFGINAEGCVPVVAGCTDPTALNYNANATEDDGSCVYPESCDLNQVFITIVSQSFGSEMSWNLIAEDGSIAASGSGYGSWNYYSQVLCLADGCYQFEMNDSWGDGWNGGYYAISTGNSYYEGSLYYGSNASEMIGINSTCGQVAGCTDPAALNYNPQANMEDGSCVYNQFNFQGNNGLFNGLELEFSLYPNPTNGGIVVNLNNLDERSNLTVNITSLEGKLIRSEFVANADKGRRFDMNVSDLSAGYYFVQIINGTNVKTLPLIKE